LLQLPSAVFHHLLQRRSVVLRPHAGTTASGAACEREKWEEGAPDPSHSTELPSRGPSIAAGGGRVEMERQWDLYEAKESLMEVVSVFMSKPTTHYLVLIISHIHSKRVHR
jgi:hypothetical protein